MQKHDVTATATLFFKAAFLSDSRHWGGSAGQHTCAALMQRWKGLHMHFGVAPKSPFEKVITTLTE